MSTLRLTRRPQPLENGLAVLYLAHPSLGSIQVISGAPGRQNFRTRSDAVPGRLEPIPEGIYKLGPLEWANGRGNYDAWWSGALGPVWMTIDPARAIGFHLDANAAQGSPGTAGCVGFRSMRALQEFVRWAESGELEHLIVDWGLNSVPPPEATAPAPARWTKAYLNDGRTSAYVHGNQVAELDVRVQRDASGQLHVWRDGKEVPCSSLALQFLEK